MDEPLMKQAEILSDRDYAIVISQENTTAGKPIYMAKNPELMGCIAQGDSLEEAIESLREARIDYIYDSLKNGNPVPEPGIKKTQTRIVETKDRSIYLDSKHFKIDKHIPSDVPSEPLTHQIQQHSGV